MKHSTAKLAALALALALTAIPLAACSGQSGSGGTATPDSGNQASAVDTSSWKTLGDALELATESPTAGYDDNYYVCVIESNDSFFRVVAKTNKEVSDKIMALDISSDTYLEDLAKTAGSLELVSAEDITADKVSDSDLEAYVGKTGQDMLDDGFAFTDYYMYGGDETGANMTKGNFTYNVTFDVSIAEDATGDEGAAIKSATIKSAEFGTAADSVTDPMNIK